MKIFVLSFFFISLQALGQNDTKEQKTDSILYYLDNAKQENTIKFIKRAILLSTQINNDSLLKKATIKFGFDSYRRRDTTDLQEANQILRVLYLKNKDSLALAKKHHFKALIFRIQNKLDSSYYYYNQSKDISIKLKEPLDVGIRLKSMATMQKNERDYVGAKITIVKALEYLEPLEEITFTRDSYNILGNILTNSHQFEEARYYFNKAKKKNDLEKSNNIKEREELFILNNIGYSYLVEKKYKKAISVLEKALSVPNIKEDYKSTYKLLLENIAPCKYELGRKKEAWEDLNKLLRLREKEDNAYRQSRTHNNFAHYYIIESENKKALYHAKKSYELSKKANHNFMTQISLGNLAILTSGEESKEYIKEYIALRDKLYEREANLKEQFALVRYETEKKEKENVGLKLKDSRNQSIIESERLQKIIFALIGVLALVVSISYFRNRRKKMMYESQLQKATAREEERQQIAKSLHDEVAGDLRILHQKLANSDLEQEAKSLEVIKENVRNLSHQLSSESFDEVSFKDQVINLVTDYFSPSFRISSKGIDAVSWEEVNDTIKRTFYLSIRESMQNTLKYAEASKFFISFSMEKKEIVLFLEDNGKGFDISSGKKGIGLKNLKERVEEIHGSFQIESTEKGTKTRISIPVNGK